MFIAYSIVAICIIIAQGQTPPCHLPSQDKFIFVPMRAHQQSALCDPMTKSLKFLVLRTKPNTCQYNYAGKVYKVLKKKSIEEYAQWEYCSDDAIKNFDGYICQYKDTCYKRSDIEHQIEEEGAQPKDTCRKLIEQLKTLNFNKFTQMFDMDKPPCNLEELIEGPKTPHSMLPGGDDRLLRKSVEQHNPTIGQFRYENTGAVTPKSRFEQHNYQRPNFYAHPESQPNQKTTSRVPKVQDYGNLENTMQESPAIDSCRNGRYNGVFYENDNPTHCIINDLSSNHGKCVAIKTLNIRIRDQLKMEDFVYDKNVDNTIEYKRYILKHRLFMYEEYDAVPSQELLRQRLEHPYDRLQKARLDFDYDMYYEVFLRAGDALMYYDIKGEFPIDTRRVPGRSYPAKHLCDLFFSYYPIPNGKLLDGSLIDDCPNVQFPGQANRKCRLRSDIEFPTESEFVLYGQDKKPRGCHIKRNHADFYRLGHRCLLFKDAETLLNAKNNFDEDVEPGHSRMMEDGDPYMSDADISWENKTQGHYRRNYMAGVLRLYKMSHKPRQYHEPEEFYWSTLRGRNVTIQQILSDIENALGYEQDAKREFTINNPRNYPSRDVKISMSVNAFCRAMLEMIPFSRSHLRNIHLPHCFSRTA